MTKENKDPSRAEVGALPVSRLAETAYDLSSKSLIARAKRWG